MPYWRAQSRYPPSTHWTRLTGERPTQVTSPTPLPLWPCSHQGFSTRPCRYRAPRWYIIVCWRVVVLLLSLWPNSAIQEQGECPCRDAFQWLQTSTTAMYSVRARWGSTWAWSVPSACRSIGTVGCRLPPSALSQW